MAIILDGNIGVTYPDVTTQNTSAVIGGKLPDARLPAGSVLQVVQSDLSGTYSFSTTSLALITGFTASITPKFSTSKILMMVSLGKVTNTSAGLGSQAFAFARNGTLIGTGGSAGARMLDTFNVPTLADGNHGPSAAFSYLDSPATTSAITYSLYGAVQGNTTYINRNVSDPNSGETYPARTTSTIILMEIAA